MKTQFNYFWFYGLAICSIIYAYSYLRVGFSNPGFAKPSTILPHPMAQICEKCKVFKTRETYHC
jgi:hypothetical protein